MAHIASIEIFKTDLAFKAVIAHALKKRAMSESIFVKVTLDNGVRGFGEALPRTYVTGDTQDSVFLTLTAYAGQLLGRALPEGAEGLAFIRSLSPLEGEARCALEIALLDCLGKVCGKSITELFGGNPQAALEYSGVISSGSLFKTALICQKAKQIKFGQIKVKVGAANDIARLRLCRWMLPQVDMRVDANGAWDKEKAVLMIAQMRPFKISCVEQPVAKGDFVGLKHSADCCNEPIMADESLCTLHDAQRLAQEKICDMFNVRLSKCGGITRSLQIIDIAKKYGIAYQIGCHVGESGILSAAGRHLAAIAGGAKYLEGCYGRWVLKEDVIEEDLSPCQASLIPLTQPGLGVTVKEGIIRKHTKEHKTICSK